jgi:hypothetical protein
MQDAFERWEGRGQFAGHETFPLRLLWLKKALNAVGNGVSIGYFHEPDAIAQFGVGRNMAVSMRHWAMAAGMLEERDRKLRPTPVGRALLSDAGWDPYLEKPGSLWLVHWHFASEASQTTTIYYAFNAILAPHFDTDTLAQELSSLVAKQGWRGSATTLKRDIEVLLRSYLPKEEASIEDAAEPLLAELGLIRELKPTGYYEFARGPKQTLPDGVFAYALAQFWARQGETATLSAEQVLYAPGSPGRVFKMDEDSIISRLMRMEDITEGAWLWTDTAGLKQLQRRKRVDALDLLGKAFETKAPRRRAI